MVERLDQKQTDESRAAIPTGEGVAELLRSGSYDCIAALKPIIRLATGIYFDIKKSPSPSPEV
jgi:hypothetical protein